MRKSASLACIVAMGLVTASCAEGIEGRQKETFGTLGGAAVGGLLGSQIGGGRGKLVATGGGRAYRRSHRQPDRQEPRPCGPSRGGQSLFARAGGADRGDDQLEQSEKRQHRHLHSGPRGNIFIRPLLP